MRGMPVQKKVFTLDNTGHKTLEVPPCYYLGAGPGVTNVVSHGDELGTAFLTKATEKVIDGEISVVGTASTEVVLYLDFNA